MLPVHRLHYNLVDSLAMCNGCFLLKMAKY